jgi:hypothetical protein
MKDYRWLIIGTFAIVGVSAFMLLRSKAKIKTDIIQSDINFQNLGLGNTKK